MNRAQYLYYLTILRRRRRQQQQRRMRQQQQRRRRQQQQRRRRQEQQRRQRKAERHFNRVPIRNRYALLTGINYYDTLYGLNGCINDVDNMREFLQTRNFKSQNIKSLTDAQTNNESENKPTKHIILEELKKLLKRGGKNDLIFFHFSGHGGQLRDQQVGKGSRDEKDGLDECIYSHTLEAIRDDELKAVISQHLNPQTILVCLMDCCNSGTSLDLRFNCKDRNRIVADDRQAPTRGNVFMISGCKDPQTSDDAWLNGEFSGAMTTAFLSSYQPNKSWLFLLSEMRQWLKLRKFTQIPQWSSGRRQRIQIKNKI